MKSTRHDSERHRTPSNTMSRVLRTISVLVLGGLFLHFTATTGAQPAGPGPNNFGAAGQIIQASLLRPAIENLRIASVADPGLGTWLDLLQVRAPMASHIGPSAFATMANGYPVVQIDGEFVLRCYHKSDVAGLMMMRPSPQMMKSIGFQYGKALRASIDAGRSPPELVIKLDSIGLSPLQVIGANRMSHIVMGAAIQWVILHEIGHHQLKHFARDPVNLTESRKWELQADTWAIEKMQDLGFGLDPLLAAMEAFMLEEELRKLAALVPPVELSTHPSWQQRIENLNRFSPKTPPSFGNSIAILTVSTEASTGKAFANELYVPRHPTPGVLALFFQFDRSVRMPVEFSADGAIHIYGRTANELSEIIVSNLQSLYPSIQFIYKDLATGRVARDATTGYQFDLAYMMSATVPGFGDLRVRDVMLLDPASMFRDIVYSVEQRPSVVDRLVMIQQEMVSQVNAVYVQYAKGKIDLQAASQRVTYVSSQKTDEMEQLVGSQKFNLIKERILGNSLVASALRELSK